MSFITGSRNPCKMLLANQGKDTSCIKKKKTDYDSCHAALDSLSRLPNNDIAKCLQSDVIRAQYLFLFQGSVFFALPDGNGLLYNVTGNAEGPKPINNIQREVPCKTPYTEMLTVTNWLRRPQRFVNCLFSLGNKNKSLCKFCYRCTKFKNR